MIQSPLAVHVENQAVRRQIAPRDIEFTTVARGGFDSATLTLPEWVTREDAGLGDEAKVRVCDGRTGRVVFEGYMGQPGKTVTREQGHVWQAGVQGARVILSDSAIPYTAIVSESYDLWSQSAASVVEMSAQASTVPSSDDPCLLLTIPRGIAVAASGDKVAAQLSVFDLTAGGFDQQALLGIGGVNYTVDGGVVDTNWRTQLILDGVVGNEVARFNTLSTTATDSPPPRQVVADWAIGQNQVRIRLLKTAGAATNIADDDHWSSITGLRVTALLYDKTGAAITSAGFYTPDYLLAHQIVPDMVYKMQNWAGPTYATIDLANASIDTTFATKIKQFHHPQTVRMADLFDEIANYEPDMTWGVFESNTSNKHRFALSRFSSTPRYEADSLDGLSISGGESGLANILSYNYTNSTGTHIALVVPTTGVTVTSELGQWGRLRWAEPLEFGGESSGPDNSSEGSVLAKAYLDQSIADNQISGTLTCVRPIRDLRDGCMRWPWEIEPGYSIVVRDVSPVPTRINEVHYTDSSRSADLTLGMPPLTIEQMLNGLKRRRNRFHGIRQTNVPQT